MSSKQIQHEYFRLKFEDGILFSEFNYPVTLDLDKAMEMVEVRIGFCDGQDVPWLYDIRNLKKITKEARKYVDENGQKGIIAGAMITRSPITKFIANTYLKINRPKIPAKMFTDVDKAKEWLTQYA